MVMPADVRGYYERDAQEEWRRLERHRTEFAVSLRVLAEYLPAAPARVLATGVHDGRVAFTAAYFVHPDEITPLMEGAGLATLALVGCEGVVARQEALVNALTGREWDCWVDLNYRLGRDPSLRGAADHLLYVGRKGT